MTENSHSPIKALADQIGATRLCRLQRIFDGANGNRIAVKLEGDNPAGSVKDRPAVNMIRAAEERGDISPGDTLIEATSGNTGIALAMAAAVRGYRMKLIMPDNMSEERRLTMSVYGAESTRAIWLSKWQTTGREWCWISLPTPITRRRTTIQRARKSGSKPAGRCPTSYRRWGLPAP